MQRLERLARDQLERVYVETRRVSVDPVVAVERRAVDRVHKLLAVTRRPESPPWRRRESSR